MSTLCALGLSSFRRSVVCCRSTCFIYCNPYKPTHLNAARYFSNVGSTGPTCLKQLPVFGGCRTTRPGSQPNAIRVDRIFHTSPRSNIPPVLWLLVKPVAKLASIISGRTFRVWWKKLTPEQKQYYRARFVVRRPMIILGLGVVALASLIHYFTHIQTTPVTDRHRYVALTPTQFLKIAQFEYETTYNLVKENVLPPTNPVYQRIVGIVQRIINGNQDLAFMRDQTWTILVVESEEKNAFVLPTGHIFVYTGLLTVADTDSQLAVVLGHEIAHALLGHGAEHVSFAAVMDVIVIIALAAIWAFMPTDGIAIVTEWFYNKVMQIMLHLPYSRKLELEADEVGLQLIAKACYDVRDSTFFWSKMDIYSELEEDFVVPQWLSTHPANEIRAQKLDQLIPEAIQMRERCNCPALSINDPRTAVSLLRQMLEDNKKKSSATQENKDKPRPQVVVLPPKAQK